METACQTKVPADMLEPEGLPKVTPAATASAPTDAPVPAKEAPAATEAPAAKEAPADDAPADDAAEPMSDGEGDSGAVEPARAGDLGEKMWHGRLQKVWEEAIWPPSPRCGVVSRWEGFE